MSGIDFNPREKVLIEFALAVEIKSLNDRIETFEGALEGADYHATEEVINNDRARVAELDAIIAKLWVQR